MKPIVSSLVHRVLPPNRSQATHHPTLIMLHGRGADEEDLLGLSSSLDERLLILSVRAPYPFLHNTGYTWYDVGEVGNPEPLKFRASYEKLTAFLHDALHHYPVDPKQVYLFGFSMGTVMSYAISLTLPHFFRGVMANSGYIPEDTCLALQWSALSGLEFLVTHGVQDPVIPVEFARKANMLLQKAGARLTYREYAMAHEISIESLGDIAAWLQQRINGNH